NRAGGPSSSPHVKDDAGCRLYGQGRIGTTIAAILSSRSSGDRSSPSGEGPAVQHCFLQALHEKPANDGLRLIFADSLGEKGGPERAEFIRIQVGLHRMPERAPRQTELKRKEKLLLSEHRRAWLGPLAGMENAAGASRGSSRKPPDARF